MIFIGDILGLLFHRSSNYKLHLSLLGHSTHLNLPSILEHKSSSVVGTNTYWRFELPVFIGDNTSRLDFPSKSSLCGWPVVRAQEVNGSSGVHEVHYVLQQRKSWQPFTRRNDLKQSLLQWFWPSQDGSPYEELLSLQQNKSVGEFWCCFELILAPLSEVSEEILLGAFMNRLKEKINAEVKFFSL